MKTEELDDNNKKIISQMMAEFPPFGDHEIVYESDNAVLVQKGKDTVQYLIDYGFIINRYDLNKDDKRYMQLTEKGRELKDIGSIDSYMQVQNENADRIKANNDRKEMEVRRVGYLYWISLSIGISTAIAAFYYLLEIFRIQYHLGLPNHVFF